MFNFRLSLFQQKRMEEMSTCYRCSLYVPNTDTECPHCEGLTEQQAKELGQETNQDLAVKNKSLSRLFIIISTTIAIVLVTAIMY